MSDNNYELNSVAESIGDFIEYWGFKKVHGKVWTYLFLQGRAVSSKELKDNFQISKALLSNVINDLKRYKVIKDAGHGKHGAEMFEANPNIFEAIINVLRSREKLILSNIYAQVKSLNDCSKEDLADMNVDKSRLKELTLLVDIGVRSLNGVIKLEKLNLGAFKKFNRS
jgi:DNA-binding transcriptional regulator GbsR (MarR family)